MDKPQKPMSVVRFYVLETNDARLREKFALRLCARTNAEHLRGTVLCADDEHAAAFSKQLWMLERAAFIPNARFDSPLLAKAAIAILVPPERMRRTQVLINLSQDESIDVPSGCGRIFEVVTHAPDVLAVTRARYQAYRKRGWFPETVKIHA